MERLWIGTKVGNRERVGTKVSSTSSASLGDSPHLTFKIPPLNFTSGSVAVAVSAPVSVFTSACVMALVIVLVVAVVPKSRRFTFLCKIPNAYWSACQNRLRL